MSREGPATLTPLTPSFPGPGGLEEPFSQLVRMWSLMRIVRGILGALEAHRKRPGLEALLCEACVSWD